MKKKILMLLDHIKLVRAYNTLENKYITLNRDFEKLATLSAKEKLQYQSETEYYKNKNKELRVRLKEVKNERNNVR